MICDANSVAGGIEIARRWISGVRMLPSSAWISTYKPSDSIIAVSPEPTEARTIRTPAITAPMLGMNDNSPVTMPRTSAPGTPIRVSPIHVTRARIVIVEN
jgi:hypothetical protein